MLKRVRRQRRSSATVLGGLAVVVALTAVVAGGAQAASSGNSENAKACQKGGWEDLVRSDGTPFSNQGDCVSYAAKGGTLKPRPRTNGPPTAVLEVRTGAETWTGAGVTLFQPFAAPVTFRNTSSSDPDDGIATWSIDFGDGTSTGEITGPLRELSHTYPTDGSYTVTLVVTDLAGQPDVDSMTVGIDTDGFD